MFFVLKEEKPDIAVLQVTALETAVLILGKSDEKWIQQLFQSPI